MSNQPPKLNLIEQAILAALTARGAMTLRDIRVYVSGTRDEIANAVHRLHQRAIIRREGEGIPAVWHLPEATRDLLAPDSMGTGWQEPGTIEPKDRSARKKKK